MSSKNLKRIEVKEKCDKYDVSSEVREFVIKNYIHCSIYAEPNEGKIKQCDRCSKLFKIGDPICIMKQYEKQEHLCRSCYDKMFESVPDSDAEKYVLNGWY